MDDGGIIIRALHVLPRARIDWPASALAATATLVVVMSVAPGGCASGPAGSAAFANLDGGEGLVLGKLGVPSFHAIGARGRRMQVRALARGSAPVEARFFEDLSDDEGRTAPFLIRLPAGSYEITSWKLDFVTGEEAQEAPGVEFEVRPGASVCIGALYPLHLRRASGVPYTTALIPRDECLIIDQQLRARAPRDMPRVEAGLASNRLCASCRAEVAQGGMPALTGMFDSAALPLLVAEQQRLGEGDDLPLRWPRDVDAQARPLKLNVCVATDGRVYDARVLESAHPALDGQVLARVQTWRFQPYRMEGRPIPFCYQPRWELQRPHSADADGDGGRSTSGNPQVVRP
jgi:TonB family protein